MRRLVVGAAVSAATVVGFSSAAWAATGPQSFVIVGQNDTATVAASGPISGVGQDITVNDNTDVFDFPNGDVTIDHPETSETDNFNDVTCVGTARFAGTYSLRNGTGAYTGATGTGTYTGRAIFVGQRTAQGCSDTDGSSFFFVRATGTTTTP
jgi:hypothetical protein